MSPPYARRGSAEPERLRRAWAGRVSGCLLGKPLEVLSFQQGRSGIEAYLREAGALPLDDYVPLVEGTVVARRERATCRGHITRAEPDDDIGYTMLALLLLEEHGAGFTTADVARNWLRRLPAGLTWTAERAAYTTLLERMDPEFVNGAEAGFDLDACADNACNEWIGAQIRTDLYGWVCPGRPDLAAELARRDAALSHRGDAVDAAVFVAALAAALPLTNKLSAALETALGQIPVDCNAAHAVRKGYQLAGRDDAVDLLYEAYAGLSPLHSLNNLALVVWGLCSAGGDFGKAVTSVVAAGWDTDSNGATVGGLAALAGAPVPACWTEPWQGRIALGLAGFDELRLDEIVGRTARVAESIAGGEARPQTAPG
jgi:ADP-ribosylglycohydrolase